MRRMPDVELVLDEYLADDGLTAPDFILEVVEDRIRRQQRRPAWPIPRRTTVNTQIKLIAALAAALVVAVVGYSLVPRGQPDVGGRTPTPTSTPIVTPAATTPPPSAAGSAIDVPDGDLAGGRYAFHPFDSMPDFTVVATGPAGWRGVPNWAMTGPAGSEAPNGIAMAFLRADGMYQDGCNWDLDGTGTVGQPGDLALGPGVDDLVAALRVKGAGPAWTTSDPSPLTIDGYAGQEVEIQLPADLDLDACDKDDQGTGRYFVFSGREAGLYLQGPGTRWHMFVLDVEGTRLIIVVAYYGGTPQSELTAAQGIIETLEINP